MVAKSLPDGRMILVSCCGELFDFGRYGMAKTGRYVESRSSSFGVSWYEWRGHGGCGCHGIYVLSLYRGRMPRVWVEA